MLLSGVYSAVQRYRVAVCLLAVVCLYTAATMQRNTLIATNMLAASVSTHQSPLANVPHLYPLSSYQEPRLHYSFLSPTDNVDDFCEQIQDDSRFTFDCSKRKEYRLDLPIKVFVAGWKDNAIFWSHKLKTIKAGELMFTDGENTYLAKCGNKISYVPGITDETVADDKLDTPVFASIPPPMSLTPGSLIPSVTANTSHMPLPTWAIWNNANPQPSLPSCTDPIEVLRTCN